MGSTGTAYETGPVPGKANDDFALAPGQTTAGSRTMTAVKAVAAISERRRASADQPSPPQKKQTISPAAAVWRPAERTIARSSRPA